MGIGWDDPLPKKSKLEWYKFREGLLLLNNLFIPRCIVVSGESLDTQIHGFSDHQSKGILDGLFYSPCLDFLPIGTMRNVCCPPSGRNSRINIHI